MRWVVVDTLDSCTELEDGRTQHQEVGRGTRWWLVDQGPGLCVGHTVTQLPRWVMHLVSITGNTGALGLAWLVLVRLVDRVGIVRQAGTWLNN